ncbi:MAG TPA: hypothetical protein ENO31_02440 [Thermoprotei archaeon]|nr:hypothetical protein [Thermoprotei archaeon]
MASVAFMGSSDLADGFAAAGAQILSAPDRDHAISNLQVALWSGKYAFVIISEPWASSLSKELRDVMASSPTPVVVLSGTGVDLSSFMGALTRVVGTKVA